MPSPQPHLARHQTPKALGLSSLPLTSLRCLPPAWPSCSCFPGPRQTHSQGHPGSTAGGEPFGLLPSRPPSSPPQIMHAPRNPDLHHKGSSSSTSSKERQACGRSWPTAGDVPLATSRTLSCSPPSQPLAHPQPQRCRKKRQPHGSGRPALAATATPQLQ